MSSRVSESNVGPGSVIGAYRVVGTLGSGQMGDVYEAEAPDGTRVAVKRLRFNGYDSTETHRRFAREVRLSQALRHPNIVRVLDHGFLGATPYLVMEKLVGRDLESWLGECGPLPAAVAVAIAKQVGEGLAHAHAQGVVHRDFKPANVVLHEEGDSLRAVVCDFGIAKVYDEDGTLTASGAVLGTPLYMAPEQFIDSKRVDERCDVWALGMTLYCAVAGRPALADIKGIGELLLALKDERISKVQSFAPWVQASLARVIHAALLPRDRRFASMRDFLVALERWGPRPAPLLRSTLRTVSNEERSHPSVPSQPVLDATDLGRPDDETMHDDSRPKMDAVDDLVGTVLADRYLVGAKLGAGGMGAVYDAADLTKPQNDPTRSVALKVMLGDASSRSSESSRRFLREARAAQRVQNRHVAAVLDVGVDPTTRAHYLVMERLRGRDLAEVLKQTAALTPEVAVSLFIQACEGLAVAHGLGVVHRDIKPSNLFIHDEGGRLVLKICDFGIAKQLVSDGGGLESTELTQTGGLLGSPLYMSPEQARSAKNVDARSDIFSLTLSLHEALSGRRPWPGLTSMGEIIVAVVTEDVPPLAVLAPWVDPRIGAIVEGGLVRDVNKRTASVVDLANALRPFAMNRPVLVQDLAPLSEERRSKQYPAMPRSTAHPESPPAGASTADPVSVSRRQKSGNLGLVLGAAVGLFAVIGAVGLYTQRHRFGPTAQAPRAELTAASSTPLPVVSSLVVATTSASAAPSTSPSASASAEARHPVAGGGRPPKPTKTTPSATAAATTPATGSTVGRGNTATDLPP